MPISESTKAEPEDQVLANNDHSLLDLEQQSLTVASEAEPEDQGLANNDPS
jgi:hypothetical protein